MISVYIVTIKSLIANSLCSCRYLPESYIRSGEVSGWYFSNNYIYSLKVSFTILANINTWLMYYVFIWFHPLTPLPGYPLV
jgi:hypothetical protein